MSLDESSDWINYMECMDDSLAFLNDSVDNSPDVNVLERSQREIELEEMWEIAFYRSI